MAQDTGISWCHHSGNLWWGCTHVHAGCDHCYAEALSKRFGDDVWGVDKPRRAIKSFYKDLNKYQKIAKEAGEIHRVFIGSMMDIFEKPMPLKNEKEEMLSIDTGDLRAAFFSHIEEYPNLMFLLLTKRPSSILKYIPKIWVTGSMPKNVMFGTSVVDQQTANTLIPQLAKVPGKTFLSIEPMLSEVDITNKGIKDGYNFPTKFIHDVPCEWADPGDAYIGVDWVICGGESGPHRRPFDLAWARSLKDQCAKANTPFFFKQIDKVRDKIEGIPLDLQIQQYPEHFHSKNN